MINNVRRGHSDHKCTTICFKMSGLTEQPVKSSLIQRQGIAVVYSNDI